MCICRFPALLCHGRRWFESEGGVLHPDVFPGAKWHSLEYNPKRTRVGGTLAEVKVKWVGGKNNQINNQFINLIRRSVRINAERNCITLAFASLWSSAAACMAQKKKRLTQGSGGMWEDCVEGNERIDGQDYRLCPDCGRNLAVLVKAERRVEAALQASRWDRRYNRSPTRIRQPEYLPNKGSNYDDENCTNAPSKRQKTREINRCTPLWIKK